MSRGLLLFVLAGVAAQTDDYCDESTWTDVDGGTVCGDCYVLATNMGSYETCYNYCSAQGLGCIDAWEETGDSCTQVFNAGCDYDFAEYGTSDALCHCTGNPNDTPTPTVTQYCDESEWSDVDNGVVCGDCYVLATNMYTHGTCTGYCAEQGLGCSNAWEETGDSCTQVFNAGCDFSFATYGTSDALCMCNGGGPTPAPTAASAVPTVTQYCDESTWSDVDNGVVCGDCYVLATNMYYHETCANYCEAQGLGCVDGWEETWDSCTQVFNTGCEYNFANYGTSDALCECAGDPNATPTPTATSYCDESTWTDVDNGVVCGDCYVLATNMYFYETCTAYCEAQGAGCIDAWEETGDSCVQVYNTGCEFNFANYGTSDALCHCTGNPNDMPTPTAPPTMAMTAPLTMVETVTVSVTVGLDGLNCLEYTSAEEAIFVAALAATLDGVEESDIATPTTCVDTTRRRALLGSADSVAISSAVTARNDASSIDSALSTAVAAGTLSSNLAAAATAAGATSSVVGAATVMSASAAEPAPTAAPYLVIRDNASAASASWAIVGGAIGASVCCLVIVIGIAAYKIGKKSASAEAATQQQVPVIQVGVASAMPAVQMVTTNDQQRYDMKQNVAI